MLTRRSLLRQLAATALLPAFAGTAVGQPSPKGAADAESSSLRVLAERRGLIYGCAANTFQLRDDEFVPALAREAGILVAEYEMKRGVIEASRGQFDFGAADRLLAFTQQHAMKFRGHTLVWHKRNPAWLEEAIEKSSDSKLLTGYIEAVAGRYKGRMHSWDVVNEAVRPEDGRTDGLRNTLWLKAFGPSYIDLAFHAARHADPNALLVYNDQGCELGEPGNDRLRGAVLQLLSGMLARRVPIDAIGLQGHLQAFGSPVDQKKLRAFLDEVKSLGLRILVTEHDVDDSGGPSDIAARDRAVADASRRFLDTVLANSATIAVLTWGLSDRYLDGGLLGRQRRELPLDAAMRQTPMWHAMAEALAVT